MLLANAPLHTRQQLLLGIYLIYQYDNSLIHIWKSFLHPCPRSSYLITENAIAMLITDSFYYMQPSRVYLYGQFSIAFIRNSWSIVSR